VLTTLAGRGEEHGLASGEQRCPRAAGFPVRPERLPAKLRYARPPATATPLGGTDRCRRPESWEAAPRMQEVSLLSVVASFSSWSSVKFNLLHALTVQENSGAGDLADWTVIAALAGPSDSHRDVAGKDLRGVLEHGNQWQVCYSRGARSETRGEPGRGRVGSQVGDVREPKLHAALEGATCDPFPMSPGYVNETVGPNDSQLCQ
jgi:hypothetical protein